MSNPRVYVGTYGKYNRGSLKGGWVSLLECKSHADFLRKCRALHRGEHDPEYMIQDVEDFPDGLECGEWLSEEDFNDVIQACREEQQKEQGASLEDRLRAALLMQLGGRKAAPKSVDNDKALLEEYMQEWTKVWQDKGMLDYERKKFSSAIRLQNGGILYFEKPSIDNAFCFHDEGPDYDYYRHLMADKEKRLAQYFLDRNLSGYDEDIKRLKSLTKDCRTLYIQRQSYTGETEPLNLWKWYSWSEYDVENEPWRYTPGTYEKMTEHDRKAILQAVKHEREKFEKRLQTYLKRYGVKKIRTWTYWADA